MSLFPLIVLSALTQPGIHALDAAALHPEKLAAPPIAPAAVVSMEDKPVMNEWTGNVAIGATYSDGNTDRRGANAGADAEYRREKDRWSFNALWNYTDEDGTVTQRRLYGAAKYDRFLGEKTYVLGQASGEYDTKADLDLRATAGVGIGRQFKEDEDLKLLGEVGLSYVDENFVGTSDDAEYVAARGAYKVDWIPTEKWTVSHGAEVFPSLEDKEDVFVKADTKDRVTLTEKMFAQLQWLYTWDNTPATGKERVDNLVLLALGWSF